MPDVRTVEGTLIMARDMNDTLVFVRVVQEGSFTAAARALQIPKTTVSRRVYELEKYMGAQLLRRTTRKLSLTEAGAIYFEQCRSIASTLEAAEGAVHQLRDGPRGLRCRLGRSGRLRFGRGRDSAPLP